MDGGIINLLLSDRHEKNTTSKKIVGKLRHKACVVLCSPIGQFDYLTDHSLTRGNSVIR